MALDGHHDHERNPARAQGRLWPMQPSCQRHSRHSRHPADIRAHWISATSREPYPTNDIVPRDHAASAVLGPNEPGPGAGPKDRWNVTLGECAAGAYPYHVDVNTTTTVSAMGESEPVIIIDL